MEPIKGHVCRSCRVRLTNSRPSRTFSTSSAMRVVPPESPYYVDIPKSYQAYAPYHPQPKGGLPVPREIFPANQPERLNLAFVEKATKDPLEKNIKPASQLTEQGKHKLQMAETRKKQLREGLEGLRARKQSDLRAMSARSSAKQRERARLLVQAEREDARLTNTSVPSTMQPKNTHDVPLSVLEAEVALAKATHEAKQANYARQLKAKQDMKMDALHTLYMNARNFITSEREMNQLLKQQFEDKKRFESDITGGDSLWNLGPPDSIKDMIADAVNKPRSRSSQMNADMLSSLNASQRFANGVRGDAGRVNKDQERMKKIAEKLSGGKI